MNKDSLTDGRLWVFGYGSLIWQPGFAHDAAEVARLDGYARSFCMWSIHHRGTPERPGLVLALDACPGGHCTGLAFRVARGAEDETLAALRERELISSAYLERVLPVTLTNGRQVRAVAYVVDRDHAQYCGGLAPDRQAEVIARAAGGRGPNREYLENTVRHLAQIGIGDPDLEALADRVAALCGAR